MVPSKRSENEVMTTLSEYLVLEMGSMDPDQQGDRNNFLLPSFSKYWILSHV